MNLYSHPVMRAHGAPPPWGRSRRRWSMGAASLLGASDPAVTGVIAWSHVTSASQITSSPVFGLLANKGGGRWYASDGSKVWKYVNNRSGTAPGEMDVPSGSTGFFIATATMQP